MRCNHAHERFGDAHSLQHPVLGFFPTAASAGKLRELVHLLDIGTLENPFIRMPQKVLLIKIITASNNSFSFTHGSHKGHVATLLNLIN